MLSPPDVKVEMAYSGTFPLLKVCSSFPKEGEVTPGVLESMNTAEAGESPEG